MFTTPTTDRLLKLPEVIGDKRRSIPGFLPMSKSKFYEGIKAGLFPPPIRIGCGSFWKLSDIQRLIDQAGHSHVAST